LIAAEYATDDTAHSWYPLVITFEDTCNRQRAGLPKGGTRSKLATNSDSEFFAINTVQKTETISLLRFVANTTLNGLSVHMIVERAFTADITDYDSYKDGFDPDFVGKSAMIRQVLFVPTCMKPWDAQAPTPKGMVPFPFQIASIEDLVTISLQNDKKEANIKKSTPQIASKAPRASPQARRSGGRAGPYPRRFKSSHREAAPYNRQQDVDMDMEMPLDVIVGLPVSPPAHETEIDTIPWDLCQAALLPGAFTGCPMVSEDEQQRIRYNISTDFLAWESPAVPETCCGL
jgi:hypothetical protein